MVFDRTIQKLDLNVINKIAAGQIIESYASVIKELIENSIDSNSKNIIIYLENYGQKSIKVIDDGDGMSFEDAIICFEKHTTSKLFSYEDLTHIKTLGFRGEALSSICSISVCQIITKRKDDLTGLCITIEDGKIKNKKRVTSKTGTTITVKDLFFNIPERLKYLKSIRLELSNIISCINNLSLSYNEVNFTLYNDNKKILYYHSKNLFDSIVNVFGFPIAKNMVRLDYKTNENIKIEGYISTSKYVRSDEKNIIFIVNKRPVKSKKLIKCIKEAYNTYIPKNKYPYIVLKLEIPLNSVDINVTPLKNNIVFENEIYIFSQIVTSINKIICSINSLDQTTKINYRTMLQNIDSKDNSNLNQNKTRKNDNVTIKLLSSKILIDKYSLKYENEMLMKIFSNMKIVGQIFKLYLLFEKEQEFIVIDQHAIHEKIIYTQLKEIKEINSVELRSPIIYHASKKESSLIELYKKDLKILGFIICEFGSESYLITKIPLYLINKCNSDEITSIITEIIYGRNNKEIDTIKDEIFKQIACKSAIRAGEKCTEEQIKVLLSQSIHLKDPFTCPHGRPTIVNIKKNDFDKMFKRSRNV